MCQRAYSSQTKQPIQLVAFCKNKSVFSASSISWYSKGLRGQKERKKSCNPRILLKHSFTLSNEDRELAQTNSMITKAYALFLRRLTGKDGLQGGLLAEQEDRQRGKRLELLLQRRPFKASVNEGSSILPTQEAVSDLVSDVNHEGRVTGTRPDG